LYIVSNFLESITYFFSLVEHIIQLFPGGSYQSIPSDISFAKTMEMDLCHTSALIEKHKIHGLSPLTISRNCQNIYVFPENCDREFCVFHIPEFGQTRLN
jgi:hypothetical protein